MAQYYHPDLVRFAFVLGITVSILFYERRHLTTGGIAVPGYLAFAIFQPIVLPAVFLVALASYLAIHKGLARLTILPASAKFSLTIVCSSAIHLALDATLIAQMGVQDSSPFLRGVGYVVPGLIAHDFSRHGIAKTTVNIGLTTAVVTVAVVALIFVFPDLGRLETSPVMDVFPVDLVFLPLLVFLSLIAWLGLVRLHGLRCGGFLGGAFLTLMILQPVELLRFAIAAGMTLLIVRMVLDPVCILFGRRRFAAHMLVGACLSWVTFRVSELYFAGETISAITPSLSVLGVLLTGLIAHDADQAGIGRVALGVFLSISFTLTGTLLLIEAVTRQRLEVVAPLLVIFALGAAVLALRPAHLRALIPGAKPNETVKGGT
ncbi:poly-gamma-glutamate biosynthesis protein PgsC/CapC [Jannaschia ovalis]|uniref:Poly-gamma-glutamate biosynthesis protein PgsC/CapC n=1 Tax=Jannaschia ovalis TaxID=3038773 RepID=A0ABY8LCI0_9RHOB|nr:poly-gamma-glutamate biosynthesis protein PgsC/CapC [Jannaschia sp. GRR-S6-38]WGH77985.1 poly-gamma-glutamate biosynthesis protein PgsC/CapC [Jannaschia sp. GRR-S6-38]